MEPVVQTSRLRLAMSSVQTFIQRCLLNLENANSNATLNVAPTAIDSNTWEWMKRYRVWQANREIFLYPKSMEPELRLDKSDLFQTLEGTLLQGDVTSDLVETALLQYLQDLDLRARLDIVASYLDRDLTDANFSVLHVLGRTFASSQVLLSVRMPAAHGLPGSRDPFDRRRSHGAGGVARQANLFWVTFIAQPQPPQRISAGTDAAVSSLSFGQLGGDIISAKATAV